MKIKQSKALGMFSRIFQTFYIYNMFGYSHGPPPPSCPPLSPCPPSPFVLSSPPFPSYLHTYCPLHGAGARAGAGAGAGAPLHPSASRPRPRAPPPPPPRPRPPPPRLATAAAAPPVLSPLHPSLSSQ